MVVQHNQPGSTDQSVIRNFCIIAHIDHGKSTVADRILQLSGIVPEREMRDRFLDRMDIEQERGITIKSQAVRVPWTFDGTEYTLGMIDTPGHVAPITLAAKEGLALLNGTQASTAFALRGLFEAEDLFASAVVCGALTTEAVLGSRRPFDARIHEVRGQRGQIDAAAMYRHVLTDTSDIADSHHNCEKVQDPYSLRCQPQVMGACLTQLRQAAEVLLVEANAVSDNPLVFAQENEVVSGGNFHAEPVAMAADNIALAMAEIGALSERRIALMMDKHMSQLPPFLVRNGGVNSGFMIAQVTAAALASENKALSHPHSVDSLPTSANQEDHVSMAPAAGRRLWEMASNTRGVLAVEWLAACQGIDLREGLKSSPLLEQARHTLREHVTHYDEDRFFALDIDKAIQLLEEETLAGLLPSVL